MADQELERAKREMERWYWWGIPTFFRCPWNEAPEASDDGELQDKHYQCWQPHDHECFCDYEGF